MNVTAIPLELRELPRWVVWRWGVDPKTGKPKKPPYCPTDPGRNASNQNPADWSTFEKACSVVEAGKADGIGFALAPPYVGVDLDHELPEADQAAIMLALDSYSERSVSGTGHHVVLKAALNGHGRHPVGIGVFQDDQFFYFSGEHIVGTPATIEDRQAQLDQVLAHFLPKPQPTPQLRRSAVVDLDDRELLDKAMAAENGSKFRDLLEGRWELHGYSSQSEADLALCATLAFWTANDPGRIDRLFRSSGLYRDKWERPDYREPTIQNALVDRLYDPRPQGASPVRPSGDAPASEPPLAVPESAGAALRPTFKGTQAGTHLQRTVSEAPLRVVEATDFAAVQEASAVPLLGNATNTVIAADSDAAWYGDGGAGKTTLGLDRAVHLCAGRDWLGIAVPRPLTALWIENEGPRGKFREKLRVKLAAWDGPPLDGRLHVLEPPWSRFTFKNEAHQRQLVERILELGIDVVFAGPVQRLGVEGGGTPAEVNAFVNLLAQIRGELDRPLAFDLIHHENKADDVSGAWEGVTDTLAHVQARGNGHTAVVWRKARWAPDLHGKTWKLDWREGERYELNDTPETTDDEIADKLVELAGVQPGRSWNAYDELVAGKGQRKRVVRDRLLAEGVLVNAGTAKSMRLFLPDQTDVQEEL